MDVTLSHVLQVMTYATSSNTNFRGLLMTGATEYSAGL